MTILEVGWLGFFNVIGAGNQIREPVGTAGIGPRFLNNVAVFVKQLDQDVFDSFFTAFLHSVVVSVVEYGSMDRSRDVFAEVEADCVVTALEGDVGN